MGMFLLRPLVSQFNWGELFICVAAIYTRHLCNLSLMLFLTWTTGLSAQSPKGKRSADLPNMKKGQGGGGEKIAESFIPVGSLK